MLNPADEKLEQHLREQLPEQVFRPLEPRYLEEPRGRYRGADALLLAPATVEEVALIVRACHDARVGVIPYGGGTGLVGGQIAETGPRPVILSLERMNRVRQVLPQENVMLVEAGAILQDIHTAAESHNRLFPLSLAAKGSARIGGNLATNAGGVGVLRYGNARDLCLGLEAVMPDGQIWHGLTRLRKDNTGYDLRNLLIGSEGTLGIITAAAIKLYPRPAAEGTALLAVRDPQAALDLLTLAQGRVGQGISAFELLSRTGFDFLAEKLPDMRQPFHSPPEWSVLIDLGLDQGQDPQDALEQIFVAANEAGLSDDGVIAQSEAQRHELWELREQIPEANRLIGAISSHDISVPLGEIPAFIDRVGPALQELADVRINCFGHLGDGNLHYNLFPTKGRDRSEYEDQRAPLKQLLHDLTHAVGGSISAEHGIGRLKVADLIRYGDPVKLSAMRAIKTALDPRGIMNPGAVMAAED